jgi:DNA-binding transcriptional LysR family regulator
MSILTNRLLARIGLRHFRLAVAVAERKSILKAAGDLNISQPTATKLLQDLEYELGAPLFLRTNRGVEVNALGEAFVGHGRLLLAQAEHAAQEVADLATGAAGRVVVGTLLTAAADLLPAAIISLKYERPNVMIKVIEGANDRLLPMLQRADVDLIVGRLSEAADRDEIDQMPLYSENVIIVGRKDHPLIAGGVKRLEELVGQEWILPPPETTLRRQVEAAFRDASLPAPRLALESVSLLTNRRVLAQTNLLGVLPAQVAQHEIAGYGLAAVPIQLASIPGAVGISVRKDARLAPAAAAMVEHLRQAAQRLFAEEPETAPRASSSS